jgi:hypothetical protein
MNRNDHIPPKWTAVRIDESQHCSEGFLERCGGKVYGIYLADLNSVTYCCEITPSYCLIPVDLVAEEYPEEEDGREALYCELLENLGYDAVYMHCRDVDKMSDDNRSELSISLDEEDWRDDPERGEDEAFEHYHGCPAF